MNEKTTNNELVGLLRTMGWAFYLVIFWAVLIFGFGWKEDYFLKFSILATVSILLHWLTCCLLPKWVPPQNNMNLGKTTIPAINATAIPM